MHDTRAGVVQDSIVPTQFNANKENKDTARRLEV